MANRRGTRETALDLRRCKIQALSWAMAYQDRDMIPKVVAERICSDSEGRIWYEVDVERSTKGYRSLYGAHLVGFDTTGIDSLALWQD